MANSYLTRTQTAGNRRKGTFSAWVKRSALAYNYLISWNSTISGTSHGDWIRFNDNKLDVIKYTGSVVYRVQTNRLFRDPSAWYHIVVAYDSEQSTASNRIRIYVNGVEETSFDTSTYPSEDFDFQFNHNSIVACVGKNYNTEANFNGYMSHVAWVDGQQLAPTVFGQTDSTSGIWKFKSPSGVTWGTNGFHLKMENSGALGTDSSGESNTFTVNGDLKQAVDTPSNVFATLNPLASLPNTGVSTFTNGSTTSQGVNGSYVNGGSNLQMSSGKWYAECKYVATSSDVGRMIIGITQDVSEISRINQDTGSYNTYFNNYDGSGAKSVQGSNPSSYGNAYGINDIIGIALDLDNEKLYFSINGTWQNSGVPTSGSTGTGAITGFSSPSSSISGGYFFFSGSNSNAQNNTVSWNFGNGFFGTTAITSAGSNGNGSLFEYDVPSGYYALNTKNINTYG